MFIDGIFQLALMMAAFLCSIVAGFLFAFAVVAMPGIKALSDRDFLQAFKVMDRVIQNNQPVFMLAWVGSILFLLLSAILGFNRLAGLERLLLLSATVLYLFGVQLPTMTINIPLNNRLQALDLSELDAAALQNARRKFEPRWNRSNVFRTVVASLVSGLLLGLLFLQ